MTHFSFKYITFSLMTAVIILVVIICCGEKNFIKPMFGNIIYKYNDTKTYKMSGEAILNPFMGFAVSADNKSAVKDGTLVYIDVTFKELQPDSPHEFDFDSIEKENNINMWKKQGKHAVLRFVCDYPSDESHSDIPNWLMDITGDGTFYDTSYGKGYSPDYNNETFLHYHQKAIKALAQYFDDGFVSYVQLGSLGHWGEWHVKRGEGIVPVPKEETREKYVRHYTDVFKNAKLMMRRPFNVVKENELGLFNDMMGNGDDTREWLDWIKYGGEYSQTGEENALSPVPDFWKKAPSGGEMTSSVPMEEICTKGLDETVKLMKESHTTFIGPKTPIGSEEKEALPYKNAVKKILSSIGYRIGICEVNVRQLRFSGNISISLRWKNDGVAPIYFDLPVKLYKRGEDGEFEELASVDVKLSEIMPGETVSSRTKISDSVTFDSETLYVGIIDPMTNKPSLQLASKQKSKDGYTEIYRFE